MGAGLASRHRTRSVLPRAEPDGSPGPIPRAVGVWPSFRRDLLFLGAYLTLRGYHSLDGDQAYRLPLLLHWLDPGLYADDPFVRSFDAFNPHRGWLGLLAGLTTALGLSAALLVLFVATFLLTCRGIDRLARAAWPERAGSVGSIALALLLLAKAGNIGTNHLFEAMVLDRLAALALGWSALALVVAGSARGGWLLAVLLGLAAVVHPSLGLQLALLAAGACGLFALLGDRLEVPRRSALASMALALASVVPGLLLNLRSGDLLTTGLPAADLWHLAVELQSPQHMLPHLWRLPQWLAWGSYLVLAGLTVARRGRPPRARLRLLLVLGLILAGLAIAGIAIEVFRHTRITLFQPFRMATVARGLALVLIAGRLQALWSAGTWLARTRCVLLATGLAGDWMMVVATVVEVSCACAEGLAAALARPGFALQRRGSTAAAWSSLPGLLPAFALAATLACGLIFLGRHDTESGHRVLLGVLAAWTLIGLGYRSWRARGPSAGRVETGTLRAGPAALALAWTVPLLALLAGSLPDGSALARSVLVRGLVARCRFTPVPLDDVERLGLWCRAHTPPSARFIGPPGPKTFRLWSRRSLAFNRAGSPYHAAGLADWFERFRDHVGSAEPPEVFVRRYQSARHRLESGYDTMSPQALAALARRQGSDHVLASISAAGGAEGRPAAGDSSPLRLLHAEGRYAVYRVEPAAESGRPGPGS